MAATEMYKVKPIHENTSIADALPQTMYKMRNFHKVPAAEMVTDSPELEELRHRQETVIKDLEKLKAEIFQIGSEIGVESDGSFTKAQKSSCVPTSTMDPVTIVVKASPQALPLSLFLLQKIMEQRGLAFRTVTHVHSSLTVPVPVWLHKIFESTSSATNLHTNNGVTLRLIWEDQILAPSLMVSVPDQSPILGEVNILRYLCRLLLPDLYSGPGPLEKANVDTWLDAAIQITPSKIVQEDKSFIQSLNSHLRQCKWLAGNGPSLADIYCSIRVIKMSGSNTLSNNVKTWLTTCREALPGFEDVEMLYK